MKELKLTLFVVTRTELTMLNRVLGDFLTRPKALSKGTFAEKELTGCAGAFWLRVAEVMHGKDGKRRRKRRSEKR